MFECNLQEFVNWNTIPKNIQFPYVTLDFNWSLISNSKLVYLAFMMLENTSVDIPKPKKEFFSIINDEIQKIT